VTTTGRTTTATELTPAPRWLVPIVVWQAAYALAAAVAAVAVATGAWLEVSDLVRWLLAALGAVVAVLGAMASRWIPGRNHRGRATAFFLDYLLAVVAGFLVLQATNVFNGLDALGATFSRGLPFLGLVVVGWLVAGFATRREHEGLRRASRWLVLGGLAAALVAVGLFPGLWTFLTRLPQPSALVPLLIGGVAVAAAIVLWGERASEFFGSTQTQTEVMNGWLFVSPNVFGFLAFFAGPLVISLYVSFTNSDGLRQADFIGIDNYVALVSDRLFLLSLRNILVFGLMAVPLSVIPALLLSALLNSKLPGMKAFRAIYFIPSIAGVIGVALIWKQIYNASVGFLNYGILRAVELVNLIPGVELTAPQPQWLSSPETALLSVVIVFSFMTIGFNTVLFVAGMQGIPTSLYEAADIDGASAWVRFRRITVPLLKPTTTFVVTTTTILALQMFNEPFVLMAPQLGPNGPQNATLTPVIYLYQKAFQQFQQGYASAVAWVLFLFIFGITLLYFRRQGDEGVLSG
jgi:ABC-type sugar transport system permease subunit